SAPAARSVIMRFAVSVVTWRHADSRVPLSGCSLANRARICRSTGMDRSAHSVRRRPSSARAISLMSCLATAVCTLMGSSAGGRQQVLHAVGPFPGEKVDLLGPAVVLIDPAEGPPAEVSVGRGLTVNWPLELQGVNDAARRQVEDLVHDPLDFGIGHGAGAEGLHQYGDRARHADRVG